MAIPDSDVHSIGFRSNIFFQWQIQDIDEFMNIFETLLFSINNEDTNCHEMSDTIRLLLTHINHLRHFSTFQYSPYLDKSLVSEGCHEESTVIHHLCMEQKHLALALLFSNLHPHIAAREAQKVAYIRVDYSENINGQEIYHDLEFNHSPIQAAWEGMLFDTENVNKLKNIHCFDDLTGEWKDLWITTVYLLQASDGKPIGMTGNEDWNILHALARYGHDKVHSAVIWLAVRLNPRFVLEPNNEGNLPLHEATRSQVYYKCHKSIYKLGLKGSTGVKSPSSCDPVQKTSFHGGVTQAESWNDLCLFLEKEAFVMNQDLSPLLMLLDVYPHAASLYDHDYRLPLHLMLIHHKTSHHRWLSVKESREYDDDECIDRYGMDSLNVAKALILSNPRSLNCIEPLTGLYPFMLAASGDTTTGLDMVFTLLSAKPVFHF